MVSPYEIPFFFCRAEFKKKQQVADIIIAPWQEGGLSKSMIVPNLFFTKKILHRQ